MYGEPPPLLPGWLLLWVTLAQPPQSHFPPWASTPLSANGRWSGLGGPRRALGLDPRPLSGRVGVLAPAGLEVRGSGGPVRPQWEFWGEPSMAEGPSGRAGLVLSFLPTCPGKSSPTSPCFEDGLMPLFL